MTTRKRIRASRFRPEPTKDALVVVIRDARGVVGHVALGSALLDADWDGALSMLPSGDEAEGIADFFCDTPAQARAAMDELAEIGDVPFHPRDFEPRWFSPRQATAAVDWLLGHRGDRRARRLLTDAVCAELDRLRRVLQGACRPGYRFHLVEAEPGEELTFAGPALKGWPENNETHLTRSAPAGSRGPRR
jgi:hypothetical protein